MNHATSITPERLQMFFHPRSIALVGATDRSRWSIKMIVLSNTSIDLTPFSRYISDRAGIHFVGGIEHGMTALGKALGLS